MHLRASFARCSFTTQSEEANVGKDKIRMLRLPVYPSHASQRLTVGDKAWVIDHKEVRQYWVRSIQFELLHLGNREPELICTGFTFWEQKGGLMPHNSETMSEYFRPFEVYTNRPTAVRHARWHAVEGVSDEQWACAIGTREDDKSLDTCEMQRCCANVSQLRDYLLKCQRDGGLIHRDWRDLRHLLPQHEHPLPDGKRPKNLDKILSKLGLLKFVNDKRR
jgi:hypothetical protein